MYALRPLLVAAASALLAFSNINIAFASTFHCGLPIHFSVGDNNKDKADFYNSQLNIEVPDYGYTVLTYPGSNTITFGITNVAVSFHANVQYQTRGGRAAMPSKPISQTFTDRISGIAQRMQLNYTVSSINDCHLFLLPVGIDRLSVSTKIAQKIRSLGETCLTTAICQKIGTMNRLYRVGSSYMSGMHQLPGLAGPSMTFQGSYYKSPFQNAFNRLVDDGVMSLVGSLRASGRSRINIPKIDAHFKVKGIIFKSKAHLEATNGTFGELTAIVRKTEPTVSHNGMKFTLISEFMIRPASASYTYNMNYQHKKSKGKFTATMSSVNIEVKFLADYTRVPCIATLDEVTVKDFGKVDYSFWNIGNLKSLVNKKVWLDKDVQSGIAKAIEQQIITTVQTRQPALWTFNCERFRP